MLDVAVVGAGPAGSAVALALARRGSSVALLERGVRGERRVGESLPGIAVASLSQLGLLDDFRKQGHRPAYALRSYWGSALPRERLSIFDRYGPGFHLDRRRFDRWLFEHALASGVRHIRCSAIGPITRAPGGDWSIVCPSLAMDARVDARWLVDASGSGAWLSRRVGARRVWGQRLVGIARWFQQRELEPVTVVEAAPEGYFYSAPLPDGTLVAVWITDAQTESARAGRDIALWQRCLHSAPATESRLRGAKPLGAPVVRRAGPELTRWSGISRFLPVGDAACTFDPIAGEGLSFALRSALDVASTITESQLGVDSPEEYQRGVSRALAAHCAARAQAYRAETRFPGQLFWERAQQSPHSDLG